MVPQNLDFPTHIGINSEVYNAARHAAPKLNISLLPLASFAFKLRICFPEISCYFQYPPKSMRKCDLFSKHGSVNVFLGILYFLCHLPSKNVL